MKKFISLLLPTLIVLGILLVVAGIAGACFTYQNVVRENIVTPSDATIPNTPVRGPFTLKAQADTIRMHVLRMTGGKTYAEMPRQIPKLDESGAEMIGTDGKPVMVANTARDTWITATALITALNLAILAYALSGVILLLGIILVLIGAILFTVVGKFGWQSTVNT